MTLGERISSKRRSSGLSQEELGNIIGVSRQSIYKWETDQATPELEKLIQLSKVFNTTVGWLINEESETPDPEPTPPKDAVPVKTKPKSNKPIYILCGILSLAVIIGGVKLNNLENNYNSLKYHVNDISVHTSQQINSIINAVENAIANFSNLTVSESVKLKSMDYSTNTISFYVSAKPRTYKSGMTAVVHAKSGDETFSFNGVLGEDNSFSAEITVPLTDNIDISIDFASAGTVETAPLEKFSGMYSSSFGSFDIIWSVAMSTDKNGVFEKYCDINRFMAEFADYSEQFGVELPPIPKIAEMKMELFEDGIKIADYEYIDGVPEDLNYVGNDSSYYQTIFFKRPEGLTAKAGHTYKEVLTVTDEYGRMCTTTQESIYE